MLWILEPEIGHHIHKKVNITIWFQYFYQTYLKKTLIALPNLYFPKTAFTETYLNVDDEEKRILHFTFLFPLFISQNEIQKVVQAHYIASDKQTQKTIYLHTDN